MLIVLGKGRRAGTCEASRLEPKDSTAVTATRLGEFRLPTDPSLPWLLPRSAEQARLISGLHRQACRLADYGYQAKTGPLVWNRHKPRLAAAHRPGCVPLIWAESVSSPGRFQFRARRRNHTPYYQVGANEDWLLIKQPCVLLQRTTAKEQSRRLIAAELSADFVSTHGAVTAENHLNMVVPVTGVPEIAPSTLVAVLNSRVVDQVSRCMNGSVAVSAYELESLPLPGHAQMMRVQRMLQDGAAREHIERELERSYVDAG